MPGQIALERSVLWACWVAVLGFSACRVDRSPGHEPSVHLRDSSSSEALADSGKPGAGDAGETSIGVRVRYKVPAAGGMVMVTAGSVHPIAFRFPSSAGGLSVLLTPVANHRPGWPLAQFSDAVQMEPDGSSSMSRFWSRPRAETCC